MSEYSVMYYFKFGVCETDKTFICDETLSQSNIISNTYSQFPPKAQPYLKAKAFLE